MNYVYPKIQPVLDILKIKVHFRISIIHLRISLNDKKIYICKRKREDLAYP